MKLLDILKGKFDELKKSPHPRIGKILKAKNVDVDVDIDIFEEESYLVGLIETVLNGGKIDEVRINPTIAVNLEKLNPNSFDDPESIIQLRNFHSKLLEISALLAKIANVKVRK